MNKKLLSVLLALVLALSLCLVTAAPVAATAPVNLISVGVDSSAEWVDAETMAPQAPCTGAYSLKLYALKGTGEGGGAAGVYIPVDVAIKDIDSLSFARLGTIDNKDAKVNLLIDADNDGDLDFTEIDALAYHLDGTGGLEVFGEDAMLWLNPKGLIDTDTWDTVDVYNTGGGAGGSTYSYWGTDKTGTLHWTNNAGLGDAGGVQEVGSLEGGAIDPTDKVLGVIVLHGAGSGVDDRSVYIDDVNINGVTYELEEALSGWHVYDGKSIQDAIDIVASGDTINVAAGTYPDPVAIDKSLSIIGEGSSVVSVTGGIQIGGPFDGLTLEGLYLSGDVPGDFRTAVINSYLSTDPEPVSDITIRNCVLDGENVEGRMAFYGKHITGTWTWDGNEIKNFSYFYLIDNTCSCPPDEVPYKLSHIVFTGNNIHDVAGSIAFRGKFGEKIETAVIAGNTIDYSMITSVNSQCWAAIEVNNVLELHVYDNTVTGVPEVSWGGEGQAFQFWGVDTLDVYNNTITNNYQGIFVVGLAFDITYSVPGGSIHHNNIVGNEQYGIKVDEAAIGGPLDATNNWWGHSSGPSGEDRRGSGDAISTKVDPQPWLLEVEGLTEENLRYDKTVALNSGWTIVSPSAELESWVAVDAEELMYTYDHIDGTGGFTADFVLGPITPMFIKSVDGGGIGFKYADDSQGIFTTYLEAGWNLIGIPKTIADPEAILSPIRFGVNSEVALATLASQGNYNPSEETFYESMLSGVPKEVILHASDGYWAYMNVAKEFGVVVVE